MRGPWWEQFLKKYEPTLPEEFHLDLEYIFTQTKEESDDEGHKKLRTQEYVPRGKISASSSSPLKTPSNIKEDGYFSLPEDRKIQPFDRMSNSISDNVSNLDVISNSR